MRKKWMNAVVVIAILVAATSALADKAEVEKKAKKAVVSLDVKKMDAVEVFDKISTLSKIRIKTDGLPGTTPKVSMKLEKVSALDAIRMTAMMAGLDYTIVDNGILVSSKKKKIKIKK